MKSHGKIGRNVAFSSCLCINIPHLSCMILPYFLNFFDLIKTVLLYTENLK